MLYFRAELDGPLVAVARLTEDGRAYRISRNRPQWERSPQLDRLARRLPSDLLHWELVDRATGEASADELAGAGAVAT